MESSEKPPKKYSRRKILITGAGASAVVLGSLIGIRGLTTKNGAVNTQDVSPQATEDMHPAEQLRGKDVNFTEKYYPELNESSVSQSGEIITRKGRKITYINFSNAQFDEAAAKMFYDYLEKMLDKKRGFKITVNGVPIDYHIAPLEKDIVLFITEPGLPIPTPVKAVSPNLPYEEITGLTLNNQNETVTYLKNSQTRLIAKPDKSGLVDENPNLVFATEACQELFDVLTEDGRNYGPGQEMFANSIKVAYGFRSLNIPYESYANSVKDPNSGVMIPGQPSRIRFLTLTAEDYQSIPVVQPIR